MIRQITKVDMHVVKAVGKLGGNVSVPEIASYANLNVTGALYKRVDDLVLKIGSSPALLEMKRCKDESDSTQYRFSLTEFGKEVVAKMVGKKSNRVTFFRLVNLKEV